MWTACNKKSIAIANFRGREIIPNHGLDFEFGDNLIITSEHDDWCEGYHMEDPCYSGIFPKNHILEINHVDPIVAEVGEVAREWVEVWKKLFVENSSYQFGVITKALNDILDGRKILINGTLTQDQIRELKLKLANKIDWGNKRLGLDLVPRREPDLVPLDPNSLGVVELHEHHMRSVENSSYNTIRRKKEKIKMSQNLLLFIKDFSCNLLDDVEIYFSIYDGRVGDFVTEKLMIRVNSSFNFLDKIQQNAVFEDLSLDSSEMYLVAHVVRLGRMFYESSGKKSQQVYKRPYACACLPISEMDGESELKFFTTEEKDFNTIHEILIKKLTSKLTSLNSYALVALKKDQMPPKCNFKVRKIGFPDVIIPGVIRNDLYITIESGEFEGKSKNVEVSICLLNESGVLVKGCIFGSANNGSDNYNSTVYYHNTCPKWAETVRIALPLELFAECHIRFELRHCSTKKPEKKLFAFAFINLNTKEGTSIVDDLHELPIYKCEDFNKLVPVAYLSLDPSSHPHVIGNAHFQRSKETLNVKSRLVSTKLTQNVDLVQLLKHKSNNNLSKTLTQINELNGEELVKFLQDVLDVLFELFSNEEGNSTEYSGQVFTILVKLYFILEDGRFEHFKKTLEVYLEGHFAAALVYKGLLSTIKHYVQSTSKTEKKKDIQNCLKAGEFLFKFIVQSQILFGRATGGTLEDSFYRDVQSLFEAFSDLLLSNDEFETQSAMLLNMHKMYTQLVRVLPEYEVTKFVIGVFAKCPLKDSADLLSPAKLKALYHLVKSPLFEKKDCRVQILQEVCRHLRHHIGHREELTICTDVLSTVLKFLHGKDDVHSEIEILTTTLEMLVQSVLVLERSSVIVGNLVTCLFSLLQQMNKFHYNRVWDEFSERKPLRDFILRILLLFRDLIKQYVFPSDWIQMRLLNCKIMLSALDEIRTAMGIYLKYDPQLWTHYFNLCVIFTTQAYLKLESFGKNKKEKILANFGDMRLQMATQFLLLWENLGPTTKMDFFPIVGNLLEMSLVANTELRVMIIPIFYDLLEAEILVDSGPFGMLESELIDNFDILITEGEAMGDEEYRILFKSIMSGNKPGSSAICQQKASELANSISNLVQKLLDYRDNEDALRRMHCIYNLLLYYKSVKKDLYVRYIYKLHGMHMMAGNYVEAGFTLLLHAEICTEVEKEPIYLKIVEYFDYGKLWEKGIQIFKELAQYYEKNYEYEKLSDVLIRQAKFYERILNEYRPEVEYFRVGFFGRSPTFLRNKEFIFRGLEYEKLANFIQRILDEFPGANVLGNTRQMEDTILNSRELNLQISAVKPITSVNIVNLPEKIKNYYKTNDVSVFQFDRRIQMENEDKDNEFKNMWVERTTSVIHSNLPGILRWFEVTEKRIDELTPVKYACERLELVNKQLNEMNLLYTNEAGRNLNPFTMRLQGILDASVMGGLPKYREAFFNNENVRESDFLRLKDVISEQVRILEKSLEIHGKLVPQNLQPLHKRLIECFGQMKLIESEIKALVFVKKDQNSIVNSPLPPLPKFLPMNNRISVSSNGYGQIILDDEQLYSHLESKNEYVQMPGNGTRNDGLNGYTNINSAPENLNMTPPVLPPKNNIYSNNNENNGSSSSPPQIPKRQPRKMTNSATPPLSPSLKNPSTPPPIPPKPTGSKKVEDTYSNTEHLNINNGSLRRKSNKEYYELPKTAKEN